MDVSTQDRLADAFAEHRQRLIALAKKKLNPILLKRMGEVDSSMYDRYHVGDQVKIIGGTLEGTEGKIISIDKETGVCRVETVFFGRTTPADVDFSDIEKI